MKFLYKYPQSEFPYARLIDENRRRSKNDFEFELMDTGIFDEDRYFDVVVEYAKASPEDILIRIKAFNRSPETAELHLLPTVWFRNTWTWKEGSERPALNNATAGEKAAVIEISQARYGKRWLICDGAPELIFTENETNNRRLFGVDNRARYVKDGINDYIVRGGRDAVNPDGTGTKASALYRAQIAPGEDATIQLRLTDKEPTTLRHSAPTIVLAGMHPFGKAFDEVF